MIDTMTKSLYEQAYHNMLNVLEEQFFQGDLKAQETEFNWSRVKAFRYVMQLNSDALRKQGVKSSYYTVPYVARYWGNA